MMRRDDDPSGKDEDLLPRLFRVLGPRPSLPDDMKLGWEATFGRELANRNAQQRGQRRRYLLAACASVAALAVTVVYLQRETPAAAAVATVVMVRGHVESTTVAKPQPLRDADTLRVGQRVHIGPQAYLALRYRDVDVRMDSNTVAVLHATRLQLERGKIYVDAGPKPHQGPTLMIETSFGTLTHVGTQFVVSVNADEMRAAVREGAVAINAAGERLTISAADGPTEVLVSSAGALTTRPIAGSGALWSWVVDAAPGYTIEGRSADEFLVWASRQLGAKLDYSSEATHVHAQTVVLRGGIRAMSVAQGLVALTATTDLDVDQSDPAVLRVRTRTR